jgi:hypothetical protein
MLNDTHPSNFSVTSRNKLVIELLQLNADGYTWRNIGELYGISCGMAYRIAMDNYDPIDPAIRMVLGLDAPILPAEILEERLHWVLDLCEVVANG